MTATKDPTGRVLAEILDGRHDGRLVDIADAITQHLHSSNVRICWRLHLADDIWDEDTVTAGELVCVERILSKRDRRFSYLELDPVKSMEHRVTLVVAHLHELNGVKIDEAFAQAKALTLAVQRDMLEIYEVVDAPKDQEASPTT